MTEKELVRRFGQWVARWDIGFFAIEGGRYYIGVPDNLLERFRLLARDNLELCLQLWRDFEAGYWDVMSRVEIDQEDDEEDEGAPFFFWYESPETEREEIEQYTGTEQVYNRQSWQPLPEFTEEERKQYWSRVRELEDKEKQEQYRQLVEACLGIASSKPGPTPAIIREIRGC